MISEKLKKVQLLSKKNNNVKDGNALMAWDRDIIEEKSIVHIDWKMVIRSSNNIGVKSKIKTFFLIKM